MRAVAGIEARHLARSPLLWLGVALAAASVAPALWSSWPVLAGDDLLAYQWSAIAQPTTLRDHTSRSGHGPTTTPTRPTNSTIATGSVTTPTRPTSGPPSRPSTG